MSLPKRVMSRVTAFAPTVRRQVPHRSRSTITGKNFRAYVDNPWFRSAVHFQLAIIGEAFNQARRAHPSLRRDLGSLTEWISLRNIVIHACDGIDDDLIWTTITKEIPELIEILNVLLAEAGGEDER